jgi:hypothetical protein
MTETSKPVSRDRASDRDESMVTGLFRDRDSAEAAYAAARRLGYDASEINLILSDETRARLFPRDEPQTALGARATESVQEPPKGSELGGPVGGTVGTIAPVLAALGTLLLIPGIVIAGPVAVALTAAGAVGVAGGLVGALADWGIPKDRLHRYERDIRSGGILIGVKTRTAEDAQKLRDAWGTAPRA